MRTLGEQSPFTELQEWPDRCGCKPDPASAELFPLLCRLMILAVIAVTEKPVPTARAATVAVAMRPTGLQRARTTAVAAIPAASAPATFNAVPSSDAWQPMVSPSRAARYA